MTIKERIVLYATPALFTICMVLGAKWLASSVEVTVASSEKRIREENMDVMQKMLVKTDANAEAIDELQKRLP